MEFEFASMSNRSDLNADYVNTAQWLAIAQYVFNVIHLFINVYFTYGIYSTSLIHPNLKTLIVTIATQYSFIAIGRIGQLLNATTFFADKPLVVTNCLCIMFKIINDAALFTSCTSVLLLAIERFLATTKKQVYSYKGGRIGYAMLATTLFIGTLFSVSTLLYDMFATESFDIFKTKTSCQNLFLHPILLPLCWCFAGVTFVIGTILLFMLYRFNVLMQRKFINDCLTIRYQYNENIATLKVLIPAVAGYGVMIVLGVGISIYAFVALLQTNINSMEVQIAFQILYMIADLYGLYFIGYIFLKFKPLNSRLKKHVRWLLNLRINAAKAINPFVEKDPKYVSDFYFKQLVDAWNQAPQLNGGKKFEVKEERKPGKTSKLVYMKSVSSQQAPENSSNGKEQMFLG